MSDTKLEHFELINDDPDEIESYDAIEYIKEKSINLLESEGILNPKKCTVDLGEWNSDIDVVDLGDGNKEFLRSYYGDLKIKGVGSNDVEFDARFSSSWVITDFVKSGRLRGTPRKEIMSLLDVMIKQYKIDFIKKNCL